MPLEIADIVRVSATIRPRGVLRRQLGRTLFLTRDDTLPASGAGKVRTYSRFADVADDFPSSSTPYKAAAVYFAQSPLPRNLLVGRWAEVDVPTEIVGGAPDALVSATAISAGTFSLGGVDFTGVDMSGAPDYATVATRLATALTGSSDPRFAGATVEYIAAPQRFVVKLPAIPEIEAPLAAHSSGAGVDLAGVLGLDAASGAVVKAGSQAETIAAALDAISDLDDSFYFIALEAELNDTATMLGVSAWAGANPVMFSAESNEDAVLTTQESASVAAQMAALESPRTFLTWSKTADYKALSVAGRFSSVNFASPGSLITGKFKTLPGVLSDSLTATQKAELDRKHINHYSPYGGDNIFAEGYTLQPGTWIDIRYWIDWFVNAVQTDVYNLLRSSPRIPQTIPGLAAVEQVIEGACRQGVANGGIAPGVVSAGLSADIKQSTGDEEFDGTLSTGYLIHVGALSAQSQAERESRASPPFRVWLKGGGAIHFADIDLTFEQ